MVVHLISGGPVRVSGIPSLNSCADTISNESSNAITVHVESNATAEVTVSDRRANIGATTAKIDSA